jgi:hypothetical protein
LHAELLRRTIRRNTQIRDKIDAFRESARRKYRFRGDSDLYRWIVRLPLRILVLRGTRRGSMSPAHFHRRFS